MQAAIRTSDRGDLSQSLADSYANISSHVIYKVGNGNGNGNGNGE